MRRRSRRRLPTLLAGFRMCFAYTPAISNDGRVPEDSVTSGVRNGVYPGRSGNILVIQQPGYLYENSPTSHGTPFNYDSHVPVIFMGLASSRVTTHEKRAVNDIAPTLAAIEGVEGAERIHRARTAGNVAISRCFIASIIFWPIWGWSFGTTRRRSST